MDNWELRPKQLEYFKNANMSYNIKAGAGGSGKTYIDLFMIPKRITEAKGNGKILIMGNTQGTVERNIISELQNMYGKDVVSNVSSKNTCYMFGKLVHVFGADTTRMVSKIQGMNVQYAYCDEITTWSREVFSMLINRLRLDNSIMDATCNPKGPRHWTKEFIDRTIEKGETYYQHYTIDDGVLSERAKERQKNSLVGVDYDRLVLGLWRDAEGLIYERFSENPDKYFIDSKDVNNIRSIKIGVDFSNGGSAKHSMVATAIIGNYESVVALDSVRFDGNYTQLELGEEYVNFLLSIEGKYNVKVEETFADSANPAALRALRDALEGRGLNREVYKSNKRKVNERISATSNMIGADAFKYTENAVILRDALLEAVWDEKSEKKKRLDNGSTDVDTLDAFEYSFSSYIPQIEKSMAVN